MDLFDERPDPQPKPYLGLELLVLTLSGLILVFNFLVPLEFFFLQRDAPIAQIARIHAPEKMFGAEGLLIGKKLNVNLAQKRDLETLPGIGPTLAQRIISFREKHGPFQRMEELKRVKGVGAKKFAQIKPYLEN
jgi:competence ComEA-like helix-hairpin-helix protein